MSWLSSFLSPEKPYQDAQEQLQQYYNQAQGYQQPFMQQGQQQYGRLQDYMNQLQNPAQLQNQWAQGYETSPQAQMAQQMATQQGLNAASSMGLMGSSPALQAIQGGTTQIGLDERQKYLSDLMQKYMAGAGLSQGIYGQGANAAGQMGQNAMNMGQNMAEMKAGESGAKGGLFGNLLGMGGSILGGVMGGPLSNKFGQMIGAPQTPQYSLYGNYSPGSGMAPMR